MNIILLIVDTLRYDHVGANGNTRVRTPNLDALAARSLVFDRAFAGSYPTIPQRTDVITGSPGDPLHAWAPLRPDAWTFVRELARAGVATQLIHDTPHLVNGGHAFDFPFQAWTYIPGAEVSRPWIDDQPLTMLPNWALDPMFDYVGTDCLAAPPDHTLVTYTRANRRRRTNDDWNAARLFAAAAEFCRDNAGRDNFFLWLDCFDPHEPWDAPPEFVKMYADRGDGRIDPRAFLGTGRDPQAAPSPGPIADYQRALYAAKVSWVDHCLGRLTAALEETGLTERTAVVVTADHGTNLGENGFGKKWPVRESEAHVPLMIHVPGRPAGRTDAMVQPSDLAATILGIAGVAADLPDSRDLLAGGRGREFVVAGHHPSAWRTEGGGLFSVFADEGYLAWQAGPGGRKLYRYGSTEPVADANPDEMDRLARLGIAELSRRGLSGELASWLAGGAETAMPKAGKSPVPTGWEHYWKQLYNRW